MKKIFYLLLPVLILLTGCHNPEKTALKIGPVDVSAEEFEEAFQESRYVYMGETGREMYLEQFIDTKLILLEAERIGIDKDPDFLKDIQHFWEQALLKRAVSQKNQQFVQQINVSDSEIKQYYQQHQEDFGGKELAEVYEQVKWVLIKIKQSRGLAQWTDLLRSKSDVKINKALLGIKE